MTWLWTSAHPTARVCRAALLPAAVAWEAARHARAAPYRAGWRTRRPLPLPSIGVGSLQVGGAGKTPMASWLATRCAERGHRPGILLRGYGGDEGPLHRLLEPRAIVVENADRGLGGQIASAAGADVLVLDDHAQHLPVVTDCSLLLIGVEALLGPRQVLPAGPWRQPWTTGSADLLVLTAKQAGAAACERARGLLIAAYPDTPVSEARLDVTGWETLHGGAAVADGQLHGRPVLALCGIADPRPFLARIEALAAVRRRVVLRDHAPYGRRRCERLARAAESARVDYVVTTAKDAVKLRSAWPAGAPPVLVAQLAIRWTAGEALVTRALERCLGLRGAPRATPSTHAAASLAAGMA